MASKHLLRLAALIAALSLNFIGCAAPSLEASTSEYYYQVQQDNKGEFIGTYPIKGGPLPWKTYYEFIYDSSGRLSEINTLRKGILTKDSKLDAPIIKLRFDGTNKFIEYYDLSGNPQRNKDGVYIIKIEKDKAEKSLKLLNLDRSGLITNCNYGVAYTILALNGNGFPILCSRFDVSNKPTFGRQGEFISKYAYDNNYNIVEVRNNDSNGNLLNDNIGVATYNMTYDSNRNITMIKGFGKDGKLQLLGKTYAIIKTKYDNFGVDREIEYYSINGEICSKIINDSLGQMIESRSYDSAGNLIKNSPAIIRYNYDFQGRLIELSNYNGAGQAFIVNKTGASILKFTYDKSGNRSSASYCDSLGTRIYLNNFDTLGNVIDQVYYGGGVEPKACPQWHYASKVTHKYNKENLEEEMRFYNESGQLINISDWGVAIVRMSYNNKGQLIEKSYFDTNNKLKNLNDNIPGAIERYEYDNSGRKISTKYYDQDGKYILSKP